jgi:hypothetical protein
MPINQDAITARSDEGPSVRQSRRRRNITRNAPLDRTVRPRLLLRCGKPAQPPTQPSSPSINQPSPTSNHHHKNHSNQPGCHINPSPSYAP